MKNDQYNELIEKIRSLPKPDYERHFNKERQDQIHQHLLHVTKKNKTPTNWFRRVAIGFGSLAAVLLFLIMIIPVDQNGTLDLGQTGSNRQFNDTKDIATRIQHELEIEATKGQVRELFGKPDAITPENSIEDVSHNSEVWNYHFMRTGNSFNDGNLYQALITGEMNAQLQVTWSSNLFKKKVSSYSIYYVKDEQILVDHVSMDGINHYYITPDGSRLSVDENDQQDEITYRKINIPVSLDQMIQLFRDKNLTIDPTEEDLPSIHGVEANGYHLKEGMLYVHQYTDDQLVSTVESEVKDTYVSSNSLAQAYQFNNMILVYKYTPTYSNIETVQDIRWKLNSIIDALIVASDVNNPHQ
ncbi:hypothetical protein [Aquibacillus sediminis]|uniref:hypothetical protein n=1 Tax=Aquibacillus sediminis TaxID=2574734 RepID=UPI001108F5BF|nr:hypothetical protein [Aquibacillus sediminis]